MTLTSQPPDHLSSAVEIRDVTLRDGLQLTGKTLSVDRKVQLIREILGSGVPTIEIGSLARPDLVPAMANSLEVVGALTEDELANCWVWVATPRHVERALEAGISNLQYCLSASKAHNQANIGRDVDASLNAMPHAIDLVHTAGGRIQLCIATSFSCPFLGPVPEDVVLDIARDPRTEGADDIVICDTLGQAVPGQVARLITRVRIETSPRRIVFHGHDTWGQGVANSLAAVSAGASVVDGTLGGLGGCPFAPGASGNSSLEDLLFGLRPAWLNPSQLKHLVAAGELLMTELEEPNRSKAVQGMRSSSVAFEWADRAPPEALPLPVRGTN